MKQILCTLAAAVCVLAASAQTQVVAHRGYHARKGSAENSVSSLRNAQQLGVYGVEFDVNLTADDSLIVFHGPWHEDKAGKKRLHVQRSDYRDIVKHRIENGHTIPTLREFLQQGQQDENTRLILEVKKHATPQRETQAVEAIVALVREMGVAGHTEYLSFSQHVCRELMRLQPGARVIYVNGDLTPDELKKQGYTGLSYNLNILMNRPEWIVRAHELGLEVTLWMTNQADIVEWGIRHKVDFVSSDDPVMAKEIIRKHQKQQGR